ncbi:hypothetical protein CQA65_30740, partial [Klebsiella pneumoniae]
GSQTSDMRDLRQRVNYNLQLVTAENYLAQGNTIAASNTLRQPDQRYARFAPAGELQPAVGDGRKLPGAGQ